MTPNFPRVAGRKAGKTHSRPKFGHKKTAWQGGLMVPGVSRKLHIE